jgi:hypothetical protein
LQTALGLPKGFSAIDLDQQVAVMREKVQAAFGAQTVTQFSDPAQLEALVRRFHVRAEIQGQPSASPAAIALALLRR